MAECTIKSRINRSENTGLYRLYCPKCIPFHIHFITYSSETNTSPLIISLESFTQFHIIYNSGHYDSHEFLMLPYLLYCQSCIIHHFDFVFRQYYLKKWSKAVQICFNEKVVSLLGNRDKWDLTFYKSYFDSMTRYRQTDTLLLYTVLNK